MADFPITPATVDLGDGVERPLTRRPILAVFC